MEKVTSHSFGGHLVPHSYPLPYTSPIPLPMPREFNGKKYYGAADVAKILGVTQKTVWKWQNELYFDCPLHVPVIGLMLGCFLNAEKTSPSRWDVTGWVPSQEGLAISESKKHKTMGVDFATLHAYCVLPKPWTTARFGRDPRYVVASDKQAQETSK